MSATNADRVARYDVMQNAGIKAVNEGTVKLFAGFPTSVHYNLLVAVKLAMHLRLQGVFENLLKVTPGKENSFLVAGRDYPLHVTVHQVKGDEAKILPAITIPSFVVGQLVFDRIILDQDGALIMAAKLEPEWLGVARREIAGAAVAAGWPIGNMFIVHVTLARVLKPLEFPRRYLDLVKAWNASLTADPIVFTPTADDIFIGSVGQLLNVPKS